VTTATRVVEVVRVSDGQRVDMRDRAAAEEPLAIRIGGEPFVIVMRTPGADRDLTVGLLFGERIIRSVDDLAAIDQCADAINRENTVAVELIDPSAALVRPQRALASAASCGVCGRQSIDDLVSDLTPVSDDVAVTPVTVARLPDRLRASQRAFEETGGLHAAGIFSLDGVLLDIAEDVGRHNAVDKVIGRAVRNRQVPLSRAILCVSGRTSFEIVQKAVVAGVPILAAVSAPSSLAIDLAERTGITLVGFIRGDSFNVYAGSRRIA
jgi:FdhD protein